MFVWLHPVKNSPIINEVIQREHQMWRSQWNHLQASAVGSKADRVFFRSYTEHTTMERAVELASGICEDPP